MKIKFIINPISGTGKQSRIEELIKKNTNFEYELVFTKRSGDATILSKKAVDEKFAVVIAVGGDGTVNECAKAIIGSETALGVIPCGSGNGFAFHFGMHKNIEKSILQLNSCKTSLIDSCTANQMPFINVSGVGFDAHISHLFSNVKKRGFLSYLKLISNEIFTYKAKDYYLNYDKNNMHVKANLIAFANTSQYGNNFFISPDASTEDGLIDFVIIKEFPKWKIIPFLYQLAKGRIHLSEYVKIVRAKEMLIDSKDNILHLDGEPISTKSPIRIKAHHKTLKIFIPNE